MNYDRIYEYRFKDVNHEKKNVAWKEIASFITKELGSPEKLLDPAAGLCEFINHCPSTEKWAVDMNPSLEQWATNCQKIVIGNNLEVDLPKNYFDGVFVSHFLEHLHSQEEVAFFLEKMFESLKPGGRIAIMGPNFRHSYRDYFDFADHTVILTELGVAEHLYGAGFDLVNVYGKFLPLSFRGGLPVNKWLIKLYLNMPFAWRILGKQFLLIAQKP